MDIHHHQGVYGLNSRTKCITAPILSNVTVGLIRPYAAVACEIFRSSGKAAIGDYEVSVSVGRACLIRLFTSYSTGIEWL